MKIIIGIICVIIVFFICIATIDFINRDKIKAKQIENEEEFKSTLEKLGLAKDNIRIYLPFNKSAGCIIYTTENRLIYAREDNFEFNRVSMKEIRISEIMDIKTEVYTSQKNKMQIIALTPTFNNYQIIQQINMKIVTENETLNLYINKNEGLFNIKCIFGEDIRRILNWQQQLDEMNRFKLLVEREIKNLSKNN